MIFLFVIDTSASMNQKTSNGMYYLDSSKAAVEYFFKLREKCSRSERFMLVTCEEGIGAIKVLIIAVFLLLSLFRPVKADYCFY